MNIAYWMGFLGSLALINWVSSKAGIFGSVLDFSGVAVVLGGLGVAMLINCSFSQLWSALTAFFRLFGPAPMPDVPACIAELSRLARRAQREGGLLSLQGESPEFGRGFLRRALTVAIATGETDETRRILEAEIRNLRTSRTEDANVFRTMSVLAPMFGLLGTLLGMVGVLKTMSDPIKAAGAMALALSAAFFGIGIANFFCVPISGQIRLWALRESMILELILEGVLDIAAGRAPYNVELHLASYARDRRADEAPAARA